MNNRLLVFVILLGLWCCKMAAYNVYNTTCEQTANPLGIDILKPCFSWQLYSTERNVSQSAYQLLVATSSDRLTEKDADVWNSGKVESRQSVLVPFAGKALSSATVYYWTVRSWDNHGKCSEWSTISTFATGLLSPEDWNPAKWIALEKDREQIIPAIHQPLVSKAIGDKKVGLYRLPQFRKVFGLKKEVKQALAFITGLGQFELTINGQKAGRHFLDPGWTKFDKEALYVTFDVKSLLQSGKNIIGVMLGNGFYNIPRERYFKLLGSFGAPKMLFKLVIEYTDGTKEVVVSDRTWKATESPITYSGIYGGEDYDATKMQPGWNNQSSFNDSRWQKAVEVSQNITLRSQVGNYMAVRQELPVVLRFKNSKGQWVYDFGQNFSGIVRLRVKGKKGASVIMRPAELLNPDKTVNQNATGKPYYFKYTIGEDNKDEEWQPRFSYYGFRYVQVEGGIPAGESNPDSLPVITELLGLHTGNAAKEVGTFNCSKPMFNQIHSLIDWAIRSNMASILTDCPTREKLGWQEQNHLMEYSMQYRYDLVNLYHKIMNDMEASQRPDGAIPSVCPEYVRFADGFEDSPEWGSAFIICPWYIYQWYGDKRLITQHYPAMRKYVEYLSSRTNGHILNYGLGDWFDIGPKRPGYAQLTSKALTATAIYYYDTVLLAKMAELIGQKADATYYIRLAKEIKDAYNKRFWNAKTCTYDRNSQTANAMSLFMGLVEPENENRVLENLVKDIIDRNYGLTAGDIGYRYVLQTLAKYGRSDIIFKMNEQYNKPGYGWQLAHGATSLTESWQAYGFVSNNHLMLGHLMEWLYGGLGGIRQSDSSVAFDQLIIDPQVVGDVTKAYTAYETSYGRVECEWENVSGKYAMRVTIPANSNAVVFLPAKSVENITEYGQPVLSSKYFNYLGTKDGKARLAVGSGTYYFEVNNN